MLLKNASEKYRAALALDPEHNGIRVNYAVALLRLGQWSKGLDELHEAALREPGNPAIQFLRLFTYKSRCSHFDAESI